MTRMRRRGTRVAGSVLALVLAVSGCASDEDDTRGDTTTATLRIVNQNLLHGTACPPDSDRCDLPGRAGLFVRQLERAKCPEIIAVEEANTSTERALRAHLPGPCGYRVVFDGDPSQDRELFLTTLPVLASDRRKLAGPLRTAYWARFGSDVGAVDVVATHLASSSDDRPCDPTTCAPPCQATDTLNTCQGREAASFLEEVRGPRSIALLAGDLNAQPGAPTIRAIGNGLADTHLLIRNPPCTPSAPAQCTSGRIDDSLADMTDRRSRQTERIDYIWLVPSTRCLVVRPTGVFASRGGPRARGSTLVFPSDHSGVETTLRCRSAAADRAAAHPAATTTTTRPVTREIAGPTRDAVTAAFTNLFAPNPDPDAQLATLENAAALRESFLARKQAVGPLADQTAVRIDSFGHATPDAVDVTFSILLDGNVVLDALPGRAVRVDGRWLVSTETYCQVATLGVDTIPEACTR